MGWDHATATVSVHLDRHGDERQEEADKLWDELQEEIKKLVKQVRYEPLCPDVL